MFRYIFADWEEKAWRKSPSLICRILSCRPVQSKAYTYVGHCARCGYKKR